MENYAEESNDLEFRPVQLPNGGEIYVRTQIIEQGGDVGISDLNFDLVRQSIEQLC